MWDETIIEIKELPQHYLFVVFDGITRKSVGILKNELETELKKTGWKDSTKTVKDILKKEGVVEETDVIPKPDPVPEPTEPTLQEQFKTAKDDSEKISLLAKAMGIGD